MNVLAILGVVLFLIQPGHSAIAAGSRLDDRQLEQLHQAVCSVPVRRTTESDGGGWICDEPRDYPGYASGEVCPLNFATSHEDGLASLHFGRFTAPEPQAIAMYDASCEPHANNFGGMALFRVSGRQFTLVRYYPGERYVDCTVPPTSAGKLQTPYCFSSYLGQGQRIDLFGPLRFSSDGTVHFEKWLEAGNLDGFLTTMTPCGEGSPGLHHLIGVAFDPSRQEVVVEASVLAPQAFAKACDRYRRHDFNAQENGLRASSDAFRGHAFIRPDENAYVKWLIRFQAPKRTHRIEKTEEPVPRD